MPDELLLLLEKVEKEGKGAAPSASALVYVLLFSLFSICLTWGLVPLVHLASPLAGPGRHKVLPTLLAGLTHPHSNPVLSRNRI